MDKKTALTNSLICYQSTGALRFIDLIENILKNPRITDATLFCYQFFVSVMRKSIRTKRFDEDYQELTVISKCIRCLKDRGNKFDSNLFGAYLLKDYLKLPLEIVWWLNKHEITSMARYYYDTKYYDLAIDLIEVLNSSREHPIFISSMMVEDVIVELIRGCYQPYISVNRLATSESWKSYCVYVINSLIDLTLKIIFDETDEKFVNYLLHVKNSQHLLPNAIIKRFYLQLLYKLLENNRKNSDLYSSYTYQELWCSNLANKNLIAIYKELFTQICDMSDIINIIEQNEDDVNWKYTLTAIGVCTKVSATGPADIKESARKLIARSFQGGKVNEFVKGLLIIRQGCFEANMQMDYRTWCSNTFGHNSNFKTTQIGTIFNFFINTLGSLIQYEPLSYLTINMNCGIAAPPKCNYLVHDYKTLCKVRAKELSESPKISIKGVSINVLHVIEECNRTNSKSCMFLDLMNHNQDFKTIVENHFPKYIHNKLI